MRSTRTTTSRSRRPSWRTEKPKTRTVWKMATSSSRQTSKHRQRSSRAIEEQPHLSPDVRVIDLTSVKFSDIDVSEDSDLLLSIFGGDNKLVNNFMVSTVYLIFDSAMSVSIVCLSLCIFTRYATPRLFLWRVALLLLQDNDFQQRPVVIRGAGARLQSLRQQLFHFNTADMMNHTASEELQVWLSTQRSVTGGAHAHAHAPAATDSIKVPTGEQGK